MTDHWTEMKDDESLIICFWKDIVLYWFQKSNYLSFGIFLSFSSISEIPKNMGIIIKMKNQLPNRKSPRLPGYDYSIPGYYFVTVCTQHRIHRFGEIENGKMILNDAGKMAQSVWDSLPEQFPMVTLDTFQTMPNHIHAIIKLNAPVHIGAYRRDTPCGCPQTPCGCPQWFTKRYNGVQQRYADRHKACPYGQCG